MSPFDGPQDRFTKRRYQVSAGPSLVRIAAFNNQGQALNSAVITFDLDQAWEFLEQLEDALIEAERGEQTDPHGQLAHTEQEADGRHVRSGRALTRTKLRVVREDDP